jgi:hypothetical protein
LFLGSGDRGLVAGRSLDGGGVAGGWSAARGGERFESFESSEELGRPWPRVLQVEFRLAAVEGEPASDVQ